ncbi:DUF4489 domain-containing protein [Wukongibacter baidiensis]|uniref:DUF4489 domain-containing protein n=1 Tax=Wukongibacter baidiensis TaxID=1723361 RepID=UPI003D7F8E02
MLTYKKKDNCKGNCYDDGRKDCDAKPVLLSCGQGTSAVFPGNNTVDPVIPSPSSARVGLVTINTKGICKPVVEIEFSSIVTLITSTDFGFEKASLNFQLFRVCDDEEPALVDSWLYEIFKLETANPSLRITSSFSFTFCECLDCIGCCDYFVEVSVGGLESIETISVDNVQIAAFIGESGDCVRDEDCTKTIAKPPVDDLSLLSCGQSINGIFTNRDMGPITIGRVIIDTNDISKPTVSIEFSSIISYLQTDLSISINEFEGPEANLKFSLFRACDDRKPTLLNSWTYGIYRLGQDDTDTRIIDSFNFNFCDDSACLGCCEYFVEVSIEELVAAIIYVDNVHITALAGEGY